MECSARDSQCLLHNRPFGFGTTAYESGTNIFISRNWCLSVVGGRISPRSVSAYYGAPKVSAVAPLAPVVVPTQRRKPWPQRRQEWDSSWVLQETKKLHLLCERLPRGPVPRMETLYNGFRLLLEFKSSLEKTYSKIFNPDLNLINIIYHINQTIKL